MSWIYRTESKGIQSWILSTDRLRDLLGGSARIEALARHAADQIRRAGGVVKVQAAGGVTATFEDRDGLVAFASEWPMFAARFAPGLEVVQAWVEAETERAGDELVRRLAHARNHPMPRIPEPGPLVLRAGRTGEPAVGAAGGRGTLDAAMAAKAREARPTGKNLPDPIAARLGDFMDNPRFVRGDRLEAAGMDEGYVAVVHMDGNGIGQLIIDMLNEGEPGLERLGRFSRDLDEATRRAVAGALAATIGHRSSRHHDDTIKARPIVLGGDDVTFLVRGADALPFTRELLEHFEKHTKGIETDGDGGLTACAGAAIVKAHWPFHAAHDLAEELCRAAKKRLKSRSPDRASRSGLAFHRVTTALCRSWDDIVSNDLSAPPSPAVSDDGATEGWVMTANPYSLEELKRLEQLALALQHLHIPRGSLRRWVDLSRLDPRGAARHWDRLREVAKEKSHDHFGSWCDLLEGAGVDPETGWSRQPNADHRRTTPIPDVIEWTATLRHERRREGGGR